MTETCKTDILLLGATGFTGGLIARYLSFHSQRSQFTLAFGGRSERKLAQVVKSLGLTNNDVGLVQVDVSNENDVEQVVKSARVVINAIGPYWSYGTPTVRACARNGIHYVDLSGEAPWIFKMIQLYDYLATKTGAIIVPACGYDSIPSDISAYLSARTLHSLGLLPGRSITCHTLSGAISGGTAASALNMFESVPQEILKASSKLYSLSPVVGCRPTGPKRSPKLLYGVHVPMLVDGRAMRYQGAFFPMAPSNRAIVERTFGLFEQYSSDSKDDKGTPYIRYGSDFFYDEFLGMRSSFKAFLSSILFVLSFGLLTLRPFRFLAKMILPRSGEGPTESTMQNGFFKAVNITTSARSSPNDPVYVKSVVNGKGDPGYSLTAIMISESALSILLPPKGGSRVSKKDNIANLTPLAHKGGILTPMSAFGDQLITRLEDTGKFTFSSERIWGVYTP